MARLLGIVAMLGLFATRTAAAEEPRKKPDEAIGQQNFALGLQGGFYNPNGLFVRGGLEAASLELAGGFVPVLLSYGSDVDPKLKVIAPLEVTGQLVLGALEVTSHTRMALRVGYRYNVDLGHGATLGGQATRRWGHFQLEGLYGLTIYPDAADRLRVRGAIPADTHFNFPPSINGGLTIGVAYYP